MVITRILAAAAAVCVLLAAITPLPAQVPAPRVNDSVFWGMITEFSEEGGRFRYENLLSNESSYQKAIPALNGPKRGGAYLGVGPEQNFTYIAAIEPKIAFIVDIRRENMLEHLMYKALFEMSMDRPDFMSRLFSRQRPDGMNPESAVEDLFKSYSSETCDRHVEDATLHEVTDRLTVRHGFNLSDDDRGTIQHILETFCAAGPQIDYGFVNAPSSLTAPSYADLMTTKDSSGRNWSYLATAETFNRVRNMQLNNLIVPVVGDFAGKRAIRAIGNYLRMQNLTVSVFYISNVEQYLNDAQKINFRLNVAQLPTRNASRFIRFTPPESTTTGPLQLLLIDDRSLFHLLNTN
ncbi:MAG TPA: hypothetical protein VKY31_13300 [Terriglobia bacterium]|nr:hypothetical protein [Terriglobia bacterium]